MLEKNVSQKTVIYSTHNTPGSVYLTFGPFNQAIDRAIAAPNLMVSHCFESTSIFRCLSFLKDDIDRAAV